MLSFYAQREDKAQILVNAITMCLSSAIFGCCIEREAVWAPAIAWKFERDKTLDPPGEGAPAPLRSSPYPTDHAMLTSLWKFF